MEHEVEKWVSLEEVADHIGLSKDTIRNYIKRDQIPFYRIGKQYKFKISEIDTWIESGKSAAITDETYSADVPEPVNAKRVVKGGTGYVRRKDGELQYFVNGDWASAFSVESTSRIRYDETLPPEIEHTCPDYGLYPQHISALKKQLNT